MRVLPAALAAGGVAALAACGSAPPTPSTSAKPAAKVGARTVTLDRFNIRLHSTLTAIQQAGGPASPDPAMVTGVRASVLRSLILDEVIEQEAEYHGLTATNSQVQKEIDTDAQQAGGMGALQSQLAGAGGSLAQLEDEIRSQLNEQRLEDYFARQRAGQVERQLKAGADFATVAGAMSDDTGSNSKGGDLGALSKDQLRSGDPHFSAAVVSLPVGTYTTVPIHDSGGYDVIQVYARTATAWSVRHILVAAPAPYTVKDRPGWFTESLFTAVQHYCQADEIHVYISDAGANPCSGAPSSPASPSATAPPG